MFSVIFVLVLVGCGSGKEQKSEEEEMIEDVTNDKGFATFDEAVDFLNVRPNPYEERLENNFDEVIQETKDASYQYYILNDIAGIDVKEYTHPLYYYGYDASKITYPSFFQENFFCYARYYIEEPEGFDDVIIEKQFSPQDLLRAEEKIKEACVSDVKIQSIITWTATNDFASIAFVKINDRWFIGNPELGLLLDFNFDD